VTFDDQYSKAVGGEASWKTSDFDQAADRYAIDFSRGVATSWSTPWELQVARGPQGLLATVLVTDIVGSTERAPGGRRPAVAELLDHHDQGSPPLVERQGGRLIKSTGDSILAVSDAPGRGIRWALALRAELQGSGIEIGAGSTPARSTSAGDDVGGIAVHTAARTMAAAAGPGEILVSRPVRNSHPQGPGGRQEKVTIAGRFSPDQRYCRLCASRILARSSLGRSTTRTSMPASRRATAGHERGERKGAAACSS
jgi:class 3 adenylate cyclase